MDIQIKAKEKYLKKISVMTSAAKCLGLIFLKFAGNNYARAEQAINTEFAKLSGTRRAKSIDEMQQINLTV